MNIIKMFLCLSVAVTKGFSPKKLQRMLIIGSIESGFKTDVTGSKGEKGIFQILPVHFSSIERITGKSCNWESIDFNLDAFDYIYNLAEYWIEEKGKKFNDKNFCFYYNGGIGAVLKPNNDVKLYYKKYKKKMEFFI